MSVVLAAYNHARFVERAIDSVLQQTFQDFEIVVTDDGSTDATPDVIGSFTDPRISLRRFTVNRQDSPRNDCLARATGEAVRVASPLLPARQLPLPPAALIRRRTIDRVGGDHPLLGGLGNLDLWVRLSLDGELHVLDRDSLIAVLRVLG